MKSERKFRTSISDFIHRYRAGLHLRLPAGFRRHPRSINVLET